MSEALELVLGEVSDTERLGAWLSGSCSPPCVIGLRGDLGAGKTTLVRGFLRTRGVKDAVKSPTYTLVEPYEDLAEAVYHYDLYRLKDPGEAEYLGLRDYLAAPAIHLIEWPDQAQGHLSGFDLQVDLTHDDSRRRARIAAKSASGEAVLARLRSLASTCGS